MDNTDFDALFAELDKKEEELNKLGIYLDSPEIGSGERKTGSETEAPLPRWRRRQANSDKTAYTAFAPGVQINDYHRPAAGAGQQQGRGADFGKDASKLIIDEPEDPLGEEDIQLYMVRKRYCRDLHDANLDRLEKTVPLPVPEWRNEGMIIDQSPGVRYLRILKHLLSGQINDQAEEEMIMIRKDSLDLDYGMKQFLRAYTLLQSGPSRPKIKGVLDDADRVTRRSQTDDSLLILADAIADEVNQQDEHNAGQDRHYRSRQSQLDSEQGRAQRAYDKAHRKTKRWEP